MSHYTSGPPIANSLVQNDTDFGVLKPTLHASGYDGQFVSSTGSFSDSFSGTCH